jgi:Cys-tRNA(Pro)/Cys-tRNA(Cys) deacylase
MLPAMKTNAARLLDQLCISYELRSYEVDPDDLSAETVAQKVGLPPEQVFKTLVARGDRSGLLFAVIPGSAELELKALAALSANRSVALIALRELTPLTGYLRGGVTALASKKPLPVYVDELIELFETIAVSAGTRGLQLVLAPADYLRATHGVLGAIARDRPR